MKACIVWVIIAVILFCLSSIPAQTQPYIGHNGEGDSSRFRFAQTCVGIEYAYLPSAGNYPSFINGALTQLPLPSAQELRLRIGGRHFWGHADFYLSFPLMQTTSSSSTFFTPGVETGASYYPWRIEENTLRPFIGASFTVSQYQQSSDTFGNGALRIATAYPVHGGINYSIGNHCLSLRAQYNFSTDFDYYLSRSIKGNVRTQPWYFLLNYTYMIETTALNEYGLLDGSTVERTKSLAQDGKLNSFSIAVGPSSSFILASSPHNTTFYPFAGEHVACSVFPEFGVGYYHHGIDAQINIAYRSMSSVIQAYDFWQEVQRKALTAEVYAFLFDYNGFVPFVGAGIGYEWLSASEKDRGQLLPSVQTNGVKPCMTFGWDIRPDRIQWFILRTNLRYVPALNIPMNGKGDIRFGQLEFNFIQLVLYPQRLWAVF